MHVRRWVSDLGRSFVKPARVGASEGNGRAPPPPPAFRSRTARLTVDCFRRAARNFCVFVLGSAANLGWRHQEGGRLGRGGALRARVLFSLVGALLAAVALVSASGAATAKAQKVTRIDVSTRADVIHYLRSIQVNARGAVIERGALNYAGAHCPGARWTCASTRHTVVQIAKQGGQNRFVCKS